MVSKEYNSISYYNRNDCLNDFCNNIFEPIEYPDLIKEFINIMKTNHNEDYVYNIKIIFKNGEKLILRNVFDLRKIEQQNMGSIKNGEYVVNKIKPFWNYDYYLSFSEETLTVETSQEENERWSKLIIPYNSIELIDTYGENEKLNYNKFERETIKIGKER